MTTLAICSTLLGFVLGFRFRFLILLPVLIVGSVSLLTISMTQGQTLLQTLSTITIFAVLLQLGYVCTALFTSIAKAPRAARAVPQAAGVVVARKS